MIDLKALRRRVSGESDAQGAIGPTCLTPREAMTLIHELEAARVDAARMNWLSEMTKINYRGTTTIGMRSYPENFTVMPSWEQDGKLYSDLRMSIDAAMASKA